MPGKESGRQRLSYNIPMKFEIFSSRETDPDFASRRIMKFLGTNYSHVGMIVDGKMIYHSTAPVVNKLPVNVFLVDHEFAHRIEFNLTEREQYFSLGWLEGRIGMDYAQSQYLGFLFDWTRKYVSNKKSKTICSEYATRWMRACAGVKDARLVGLDFLSPVDAIAIALDHGIPREV